MWWLVSIIKAFGGLRQEDFHESMASLGCIAVEDMNTNKRHQGLKSSFFF